MSAFVADRSIKSALWKVNIVNVVSKKGPNGAWKIYDDNIVEGGSYILSKKVQTVPGKFAMITMWQVEEKNGS